MREQIEKAIVEWQKKGWITINEHLDPEVLSDQMIRELQNMPLRKFVETFNPFNL